MSTFKVIIIGGGLSGALLANGLINNDVDDMIYERDKEETKRGGYQIRLGEPSLSAFRACLPPAHVVTIEEKFGVSANDERTQNFYTAPCIYSTNFKVLLDLGKLPTYTISTAISRLVLRNFLVDPVKRKGRIEFDKRFSHYSIVEDKECGDKVQINHQLGLDNIQEIKSHFTTTMLSIGIEDSDDSIVTAIPLGMGNNQTMFDCTEILPPLIELNKISKSGASPSSREVRTALEKYEALMIEHGFKWVKKSGGVSVPNVDLQSGFLNSAFQTFKALFK
ncbi:FAD dependent oxidoreductase/monooxygenase [Botrytis cinerea]